MHDKIKLTKEELNDIETFCKDVVDGRYDSSDVIYGFGASIEYEVYKQTGSCFHIEVDNESKIHIKDCSNREYKTVRDLLDKYPVDERVYFFKNTAVKDIPRNWIEYNLGLNDLVSKGLGVDVVRNGESVRAAFRDDLLPIEAEKFGLKVVMSDTERERNLNKLEELENPESNDDFYDTEVNQDSFE